MAAKAWNDLASRSIPPGHRKTAGLKNNVNYSMRSNEHNENYTWHIFLLSLSPVMKIFFRTHSRRTLSGLYHKKLEKGIELFLLYFGCMISVLRLPAINRTEAGNEKVGFAIKQHEFHFKSFSVAHRVIFARQSKRLFMQLWCQRFIATIGRGRFILCSWWIEQIDNGREEPCQAKK